jgi:DNA ligase-1
LILESGVIRSNGGGAFTVPPAALPWALERGVKRLFGIGAPFLERLSVLKGLVKVHEQTIVDNNVDAFMEQVLLGGGEGVIFKSNSAYVCKRSDRMLKYKPFSDDEGTVSGYTTGRETERGSKLLGMMGSLEVLWKGKVFEISGFTEAERSLRTVGDKDGVKALSWAMENPESKVPDWIEASEFPRGSRVTFTYRELSDDGIPKEARYLRKRESE